MIKDARALYAWEQEQRQGRKQGQKDEWRGTMQRYE